MAGYGFEGNVPAASLGVVEDLPARQITMIMVGVVAGVLLSAFDQTAVNTALASIADDIGGFSGLVWVVNGYLVTAVAVTPIWGKLSDLYGRRPIFHTVVVIFVAGSALCGLAHNIVELAVFRGLQGIGAGGLYALALAITGDVVPPTRRGRYQGYLAVAYGLATIAGPLVGGWLTESYTWRWIFYASVPIGLVSLIITTRTLPRMAPGQRHHVDYFGAALVIAGILTLLLYLNWSAGSYGWAASASLALLGGFAVLTVLLLWVETAADEPIIPLHLFRNHIYRGGVMFSFASGAAMFAGTTYLPVYLHVVLGMSPIASGLAMLPVLVGIALTSVLSSIAMSRSGRYRIYPRCGAGFMLATLYAMTRFGPTTPHQWVAVVGFGFGCGVGMTTQIIITAVQNSVAQQDIGTATSSTNFFQRIGAALGTAALGAVFDNRLAEMTDVAGGETGLADLGPGWPLPALTHGHTPNALASALDNVFLAGLPFAGLALLISLFLTESPAQHPTQ